jgi:hypothetical protein
MCHQYDKQPIKPIGQNLTQEAKSSRGTRDTLSFMKPAGPSLCSQEYASGHFSQPALSNQHTSTSIN